VGATRKMRHFSAWLIFGVCAGFLGSGCGSRSETGRLAVHPATGIVTVAGQPTWGVSVILHPKGGEASKEEVTPTGTTDEDGKFTLSTYDQDDGAPVGDYSVSLRWMKEAAPSKNGPPPGFAAPVDQLKGKYSDPTKTKWSVQIVEGNNVIDTIAVD